MTNNTSPALRVSNLTTEFASRYGTVHAVNGVSFDVASGRITGIVGESGCGKSATIRSILGLLPRAGRIVNGTAEFDNRDLLSMRGRKLRALRGDSIAFVAQNPFGALNPILTIGEQFHVMAKAHRPRVKRADTRQRTLQMLQQVGIRGPERVCDGYAHQLSGGMAQRVVIAMALSLEPQLIVADEPTTALDVTIQRQILDLMRELVLSEGRSMLMVTHDLGVVAQYCDDVVVMYAGKVVESGATRDVFKDPQHPYTRALMGSVPERGQPLEVLRGRVPDLVDYPRGCPFASRCPQVHDRCLTEAPELRPVDATERRASCHLVDGPLDQPRPATARLVENEERTDCVTGAS